MKKFETLGLLLLVCTSFFDAYLWYSIFGRHPLAAAHIDPSSGGKFITLAGGATLAIDANALPAAGNLPDYIDIAVIGNMDEEDWSGFGGLLDHGALGVVIYAGRDPRNKEWNDFVEKIAARHIALLTVGAGDRISYGHNTVSFLSPDAVFARSPDQNDAGLAELITTPAFRTLIAADISQNAQNDCCIMK